MKEFYYKHSTLIVFFEGCVLGGIVFVLLYGVKILDVTSIDRMLVRSGVEDLPQHYLAWEFFRKSAWSFPLGRIDNLIFPNQVSVVYTDSIPLFAVFFKLFSGVLPAQFQYFGIWTLLCFMLQGAFGAIITYRFCRSNMISLFFSIFFVLSTVLLKRTFYHSALAAHWLILGAFAIWIYKDSFKNRYKIVWLYAFICVLAVVIEAYFVPIVLGIMLCCLFQDVLQTKKIYLAFLTVTVSLTWAIAFAWLFGYFSSGISPSTVGLGFYSFNLDGLTNSMGMSKFFGAQPLTTAGQNEGFAYLGLGTFILLGLALVHLLVRVFTTRKNLGTVLNTIKADISWVILLVVFTMFALSSVATYMDKQIYSLKLPGKVITALSVFRSSGRFIWPVFYAILIFIAYELSLLGRNVLKRIGGTSDRPRHSLKIIYYAVVHILMVTIVFLQLYDISPMLAAKHDIITTKVKYVSPFQGSEWKLLAKKHRYIYIYSPIYDLYTNYDVQSLSLLLEKYALDNNLALNAAYLSRNISTMKDEQIAKHFSEMEQGQVFNDYLYVFPRADNVPTKDCGLYYYSLDGIVIGVNTPIPNLKSLTVNSKST